MTRMFAVAADSASRKLVGERQGPGLGRRLGRAVGGVGAVGRLRLGRGDEHEAAVLGGGERVVEGAGACGSRCARAGRGATRSRRAAPSRAARRPSSRRPGAAGRRRGRSARRARRPSRAPPPRRAGRRPGRRSRSSARPRSATTASRRSWSRSVSARVAPASARRARDNGPEPAGGAGDRDHASVERSHARNLIRRGAGRAGKGGEKEPTAPPMVPKVMSSAESRLVGPSRCRARGRLRTRPAPRES